MSIKLVSWNVNGIRAVAKKDEFWEMKRLQSPFVLGRETSSLLMEMKVRNSGERVGARILINK